ncbi:MAG TPA: NrfD/PsrC family molybdoenzyme membrane anchor subunit [Candidatus Cybelea sp.]
MKNAKRAYYGRPIIKPPEWSGLIPTYFWSGGWSGASAALGLVARLSKNERLARVTTLSAAVGSLLSAFCLIADLKKPQRFLNMLRVFKPTSPMSVGVYLFAAFSGAAMTAAASELTGIARGVGRLGEGIAGLTGPLMSVYTSVLIGDTVVPAWHGARKTLPLLFAATSASTASGLAMLVCETRDAKPARRLALFSAVAVPVALERLRRELGPFQYEAYEARKAAELSHAARALNVLGCVFTLFARHRKAAKIAGVLLLAGGLAERFAVLHAGKISAQDPKFTIGPD